MNDQQQLEHFITLLTQSGLEDQRVEYWVERISSDQFSETDEQALMQELEEHLIRVDQALGVVQLEVEKKEDQLSQKEQKTVPFLEKLAREQVQAQEKQIQAYKQELSEGEKKALDKIEAVRSEKDSDAIEALRKGLGKG